LATSGDTFLLQVGQPRSLLEVAEEVTRLSGYQPGKDIPIEFTGLAAGDRVDASLTRDEESAEDTGRPGLAILIGPETPSASDIAEWVGRLRDLQSAPDPSASLAVLAHAVPASEDGDGFAPGVGEAKNGKKPWVTPQLKRLAKLEDPAAKWAPHELG
jgi:FlaA1/EpsC-like NDP-sugar epimerase